MEQLHLAEHHLFEERGQIFLYHVGSMRVYGINPALAEELMRLGAEERVHAGALSPELYGTLQALSLLECGDSRPNPQDFIPKRQPLSHVTLNVAQLCNLSCIYCYGGDGEYGERGLMPEDIAFRSIDWVIEQSLDSPLISVTFFGGEPLLNFELVKKAVAYAKSAAARAAKQVSFSITTNGTLFSDEVNAFLNEHRFSVTVSFDGDQAMQDANRPMKGGQGSFAVAKPKIEKFLATRNGRAFGRATVTSQNADLGTVRRSLHDVGFKSVGTVVAAVPTVVEAAPAEQGATLATPVGTLLVETTPSGRKKLSLPVLQPSKSNGRNGSHLAQNQAAARISEEQHERFLRDIERESEESLAAIRARRPVSDHTLPMILGQLEKRQRRYYFCGVGRSMAAVSISGDIYPCHRFVGQKEMRMGHIDDWDPDARKPYLENIGMGHEKCGKCWARSFCGGGCAHDSIQHSGSMAEPNPHWCSELHRRVELAIAVYHELDADDKRFLRL